MNTLHDLTIMETLTCYYDKNLILMLGKPALIKGADIWKIGN